MVISKIRRRLASYHRQGWGRSARIGIDRLALRALRGVYRFDRWHAESPVSARPYRRALAAKVSALKPRVVVEVGCGLGAILALVKAETRVGYDIDEGAVRAARRLRGPGIRFVRGDFTAVEEDPIDVLIAVNWIHDFDSAQLERWIAPLLPRVRYIVVDAIDRDCPVAYSYYHDFAFLTARARLISSDDFGEQFRHFLVYEIVR